MKILYTCLLCILGIGTAGLAQTAILENQGLRLELQTADASARLIDKRTQTVWELGSPQVVLAHDEVKPVRPKGGVERNQDLLVYESEFGPFQLRLRHDPPAIEYVFKGRFAPTGGAGVKEVRLLNDALAVGPGAADYYAIPERMGLLLRAGAEQPAHRRLDYSGGYSMAMMGAVRNGSALLVSWDTPEAAIMIDHSTQPRPRLGAGIALRDPCRMVSLQPLGRGGYVEVAQAYREIARQRGLLVTLAEKKGANPAIEKLLGAADFKPFVFTRLKPNTRWNRTDKEILRIGFTFDEAARLAEHLKNDLGIDRSLLVLAGWINKGYDNQHPDILPAASELGGNAGLAECSRRVKALGWLFGLHDNYQDLYRDSPSWNEDLVVKNADGSLAAGGVWAGGQAYFICSKKSLELLARPQNLAEVERICHPNAYFIDTVFASPPRPCFDPKHPETRADDIRAKQELCEMVRREGILFGSEEGFEWGVPHADYFEGILSHKKQSHAKTSEIVIPLFELVFGDAIPMFTHQSDRLSPENADHFLDCVLYAEMPVYEFGDHLYWKGSDQPRRRRPGASEGRSVFAQGTRFGRTDQFIKNTYEVLSPLNRVTGFLPMTDHRFLSADRLVESTRFGDNVRITVNYGKKNFESKDATLPPHGFLIHSPTLIAWHATRFEGQTFAAPTLVVIHSLDGQPLSKSGKVRFYRAFGDQKFQWNGKTVEVEHERIIPEEIP